MCVRAVFMDFFFLFFVKEERKVAATLMTTHRVCCVFNFYLFIYLFYHIQMCAESHLRSLSQGRRFRKTHVLSHNFYSFMVVES